MPSKSNRSRGGDPHLVVVERAVRERQVSAKPEPTCPLPVATDGRTFRTEPFSEQEIRR